MIASMAEKENASANQTAVASRLPVRKLAAGAVPKFSEAHKRAEAEERKRKARLTKPVTQVKEFKLSTSRRTRAKDKPTVYRDPDVWAPPAKTALSDKQAKVAEMKRAQQRREEAKRKMAEETRAAARERRLSLARPSTAAAAPTTPARTSGSRIPRPSTSRSSRSRPRTDDSMAADDDMGFQVDSDSLHSILGGDRAPVSGRRTTVAQAEALDPEAKARRASIAGGALRVQSRNSLSGSRAAPVADAVAAPSNVRVFSGDLGQVLAMTRSGASAAPTPARTPAAARPATSPRASTPRMRPSSAARTPSRRTAPRTPSASAGGYMPTTPSARIGMVMAEMLPTNHGAELRQVLGFGEEEEECDAGRTATPAAGAASPPFVPHALSSDVLGVVRASAAAVSLGVEDEIDDEMQALARRIKSEDQTRIHAGVWTVMRSRHNANPVAAQLAEMEDADDELVSFTADAALSAAVASEPVAMHADGPATLRAL